MRHDESRVPSNYKTQQRHDHGATCVVSAVGRREDNLRLPHGTTLTHRLTCCLSLCCAAMQQQQHLCSNKSREPQLEISAESRGSPNVCLARLRPPPTSLNWRACLVCVSEFRSPSCFQPLSMYELLLAGLLGCFGAERRGVRNKKRKKQTNGRGRK